MSNNLIISVDSTTPLTDEQIMRHHIISNPLSYSLDGKIHKDIYEDELDKQRFYEALREGKFATSSKVKPEEFVDSWRPVLLQGKNILHLSISTKVSATYDSACYARDMLSKEFPGRVKVVDTQSGGYNVTKMVLKAVVMAEAGESAEDIIMWVHKNNAKYNMLFTVDDITYLRRGGRISHLVALVGSAFNIKPILYVSGEGRFEPLHNSRGQKSTYEHIVERILANTTDETTWVHIQHGGDEGAALELVDMIRGKIKNVKHIDISVLSPVLGLNAGPGALAIYFAGKNRDEIKNG